MQTPPPTLPYQTTPPGGGQLSAPCPRCGWTYAKPVRFSFWGGMVGPRMLSHVACGRCRATYNGKTGQYNTTGIILYVVVTSVIALIVLAAFGVYLAV